MLTFSWSGVAIDRAPEVAHISIYIYFVSSTMDSIIVAHVYMFARRNSNLFYRVRAECRRHVRALGSYRKCIHISLRTKMLGRYREDN